MFTVKVSPKEAIEYDGETLTVVVCGGKAMLLPENPKNKKGNRDKNKIPIPIPIYLFVLILFFSPSVSSV